MFNLLDGTYGSVQHLTNYGKEYPHKKTQKKADGSLCVRGGVPTVVTWGGGVAVTVERVAWFEAGQGSLGGRQVELMGVGLW